MLTLNKTTEFVLPVGPVVAACPPALSLWHGSVRPSEQPSTRVRFSGTALSLSEYAGIAGGAKPAGPAAAAVNGGADLPQAKRQFHTMSRRDHRTWRPPH